MSSQLVWRFIQFNLIQRIEYSIRCSDNSLFDGSAEGVEVVEVRALNQDVLENRILWNGFPWNPLGVFQEMPGAFLDIFRLTQKPNLETHVHMVENQTKLQFSFPAEFIREVEVGVIHVALKNSAERKAILQAFGKPGLQTRHELHKSDIGDLDIPDVELALVSGDCRVEVDFFHCVGGGFFAEW